MKKIFSTASALLIAWTFTACSSPQTSETETTADSTEVTVNEENTVDPTAGEQKKFDGYSDDFKGLTLGFGTTFRKANINDALADVRDNEVATLTEETADKLTYKLELNATEHAVINYKFADGKLNAVSVLVKIDTNQDYETLESELMDFFTHKHGAPNILDDRGEIWKIGTTHEIDLLDRSKDDQFMLEVDIK